MKYLVNITLDRDRLAQPVPYESDYLNSSVRIADTGSNPPGTLFPT